jgi:hypothetical integral membrane protein (TIGR02206 family)
VPIAVVSSGAYLTSVLVSALLCGAICAAARRHPGRWADITAKVLGIALAAVATSWIVQSVVDGPWTAANSLPLPLCDVALVVAAAACWWRSPLLVELTWFWGLAGTLQAVITPDLGVAFPHLIFFQYVIGHLGIVAAALYLVVGLRITPRPGAVVRTFAITIAYTAFVGTVDAITGGDYMFLRSRPATWSLLNVLGPWPWYILGATGVAIVALVLLDLPFRPRRRQPSSVSLGHR